MEFSTEIHQVVKTALSELDVEHHSGKLANTPITNTHFLARWIAKALKQQRFSAQVKKNLETWQKQARSQGAKANLVGVFRAIDKLYSQILEADSLVPLIDKQIEAFMDQMESLDWDVVNEYEITEKIQIFADSPNSFVLCALECENCFDGEKLIKPMHFYVRGNHAQFVEQAVLAGFLVHKQTAYKSKVKYHGEYIIFPHNQGSSLAEIPLSFLAVR